jgi:DnaJ-class molecular chaperone
MTEQKSKPKPEPLGPRPKMRICEKCGGLGSVPMNGKNYNRKACPDCAATGVANRAELAQWHAAKRKADEAEAAKTEEG